MIISRGILSGLIVAISVLIAQLGGPILGGMFSTFPALFTSSLVITYFSQGTKFTASISKSFMISVNTLAIHSMAVRFLYPLLGIVWGTLFSILISYLSGYLLYSFVVKKMS